MIILYFFAVGKDWKRHLRAQNNYRTGKNWLNDKANIHY